MSLYLKPFSFRNFFLIDFIFTSVVITPNMRPDLLL